MGGPAIREEKESLASSLPPVLTHSKVVTKINVLHYKKKTTLWKQNEDDWVGIATRVLQNRKASARKGLVYCNLGVIARLFLV